MTHDAQFLAAALVGYRAQKAEIETKIAELERQLPRRRTMSNGHAATVRPAKPHVISADGRARIAAAQRKRWANAKRSKIERTKTAGSAA